MSNIDDKSTWIVETRSSWEDEWAEQAYLHPLTIMARTAPGISDGQFLYRVGDIKQADTNTFATASILDLGNKYVRVKVTWNSDPEQKIFYGIFADDNTILFSEAATRKADQEFTAFGLEYLLGKQTIHQAHVCSRCVESSSSSSSCSSSAGTLCIIDWVPSFNERSRHGGTLFGNRSPEETAFNVYPFANAGQGETWTNRDIVRYLIHYHFPRIPGLTWLLDGQHEALDAITEVHKLEGMTVFEAMNRLIPNKRGLGWYLEMNDDEDECGVRVFTLNDVAITEGPFTLPANDRPITFTIPSTFAFWHVKSAIPFRQTNINEYDKLTVRGSRVKVTATFSYADATLEPAWTDEQEDEYVAGPDEADLDEQDFDDYRNTDQFEMVYRAHRVPKCWDGGVGNGEGGEKQNIWFDADDNGTVVEGPACYWRANKKFDRQLPLLQNVGYEVSPAVDRNPPGTEPDFRPMFVLIKDDEAGDIHDPSGKWHYVEKLNAANADLTDFHVRPLEHQPGFQLTGGHGNNLGKNHLIETALRGEQGPVELDYEDLLVTATIELDQRLHISEIVGTPQETVRELVIDVDDCEYWECAGNTVIDIKPDGTLERIHPSNIVLRNDFEKLQAIFTFAKAWYFTKRQAVKIPLKRLRKWTDLGVMMTAIDGVNTHIDVKTYVTSMRYDFRQQEVTIETGYNDRDFSGDSGSGGGGSGMGARAKQIDRQAVETARELANRPVRWGQGGRGGGESGHWARITDKCQLADGRGAYSHQQVRFNACDGTWRDVEGGISGTFTACEVNGSNANIQLLGENVVWMRRATCEESSSSSSSSSSSGGGGGGGDGPAEPESSSSSSSSSCGRDIRWVFDKALGEVYNPMVV